MRTYVRAFFACMLFLILSGCGKDVGQKAADIDTSIAGHLLAGRMFHTAVWTGKNMIVYGGITQSQVNSDGSVNLLNSSGTDSVIAYDPSTNSWASDDTHGQTIVGHSAVWTGTQMIIWGGMTTAPTSSSNSALTTTLVNTGLRYDPANDLWTAMSTSNAPSPRWGHVAVWTGQTGTATPNMLVYGGSSDTMISVTSGGFDTGSMLGDGGLYDPAADQWKPIANGPARWGHSAVWTGDSLIIWGGSDKDANNNWSEVNTGKRYSLAGNVWSSISTTNAPSARSNALAAWTGTDMIVVGGMSNSGSGSSCLWSGATYNPKSDSWTPIADIPQTIGDAYHAYICPQSSSNFGSSWTAIWTGQILVLTEGNAALQYDPTTNAWSYSQLVIHNGYMQSPAAASVVWTGQEAITWGGWTYNNTSNNQGSSQYQIRNTGFRYDPANDSWSLTSILSH